MPSGIEICDLDTATTHLKEDVGGSKPQKEICLGENEVLNMNVSD